jgi:hypothetical protein
MHTEIADSDGESELNSPAKVEQHLPKHPSDTQQSATNNDFGVQFSDFVSQEQQLYEEWHMRSSNLQQKPNHAGSEPSHPSTNVGDEPAQEKNLPQHALRAVHGGPVQSELAAVETTPAMSRKRGHTTWDDGEEGGGSDQMSQKRQQRSKAKTYGNSSARMRSSQTQSSNDAFWDATHFWQAVNGSADRPEQVSFASVPAETQSISGTDTSMQLQPTASNRAIEEDGTPRQRNRPRRVLSLLGETTPHASREISTSRSSMGNYESINIDFRGTATGFDVGANPFGSLSQTSVGDGVRDADRGKIAFEPGLDIQNPSTLLPTSTFDLPGVGNDLGRWNGCSGIDAHGPYQTPGRSRSIDPMLHYNDLPKDTQLLSSSKNSAWKSCEKVAETAISPAVATDGPSINRSLSDSGLGKPKLAAKKRGPKSKSERLLSESPGLLKGEEEHAPSTDEPATGLPKEQYKPRPSRSRGATRETPTKPASPEPATKKHEHKEIELSSPVKQPTNELNLGDEALIGLPKENYKPRPSRSRSKKIITEDEGRIQLKTVEAAKVAPDSSAVVPDATDATPVKKSKRHAKKTKVKRAKTSAAALLEKSQPMLSEGEDDVLWLETKPNEVKLDLPPDMKREDHLEMKEIPEAQSGRRQVKAAGKEEITGEKGLETHQQDKDTNAASQSMDAASASAALDVMDYEPTRRADTTHITVDISSKPTSLAQLAPKKRGRKKKSSEVLNNQEVDLDGPSHSSENAAQPGLSETPEKAGAGAANTEAKKRGRKKKVSEICTERDDVNEIAEHESDTPPSEEELRNGNRSALAEKDVNLPVSHPHVKSSKHSPSDLTNETPPSENETGVEFAATHQQTPPKKASEEDAVKGPTKHSPINPSGGKALYRVGLSRRAAIPPLLKIVRKDLDRPREKEKPKRKADTQVPVEDDE